MRTALRDEGTRRKIEVYDMLVAQITAVVIFVVMFVLIVLDRIPKQWVTLGCGLIMLVLVFGIMMHSWSAIWDTLNFKSIVTLDFWYSKGESDSGGVDWATIFFLGGMMIMVEGMAEAGFFRWLCMRLAKMVNYKPLPLFLTFMILAAVLAMFIDSITVILFLAAVTFELARLLKFNPIPMLISEVFCANLGGSATMCGDPPNIIIGSRLGYSFMDFLTNTGVCASISLVVIIIYFYFFFRKKITPSGPVDISSLPKPEEAIRSKKDFIVSICIFVVAVALLVSHSATHLSVAFIGIFVAIVTCIAFATRIPKLVKRVDYNTLLFFVGLFVVVGGLEQTGVLETVADFIAKICGSNSLMMVAIIIWISAIASAFIDNIPFAATMVPIIKALSATTGVPIATLAWTLAVGTDVGGAATPIGASANVVGISVAGKNGYRVGWGKFCKASAPAMIIVIAVSMLVIFLRYCM